MLDYRVRCASAGRGMEEGLVGVRVTVRRERRLREGRRDEGRGERRVRQHSAIIGGGAHSSVTCLGVGGAAA